MSYLEKLIVNCDKSDIEVWNEQIGEYGDIDDVDGVDWSGELPDNEHILIFSKNKLIVVYEDGDTERVELISKLSFLPNFTHNDNIMREFLLNKEIDLWVTYGKLHNMIRGI